MWAKEWVGGEAAWFVVFSEGGSATAPSSCALLHRAVHGGRGGAWRRAAKVVSAGIVVVDEDLDHARGVDEAEGQAIRV